MKDSKGKKDSKTGYAKAGLPGIGAKMKEKVKELAEEQGLVFDGVWVFRAHALLKPHHQILLCDIKPSIPPNFQLQPGDGWFHQRSGTCSAYARDDLWCTLMD